MTEKRFILDDDFDWWGIIDTTGRIRENEYSERISGQIVVDLLNKLLDENEQLKQQNTELIAKIDLLERVIDGDVE